MTDVGRSEDSLRSNRAIRFGLFLRPLWAPVRWWIRKRCSIAYRLGYHDGWTDSIGAPRPEGHLVNTFGGRP